MKGTRIKKSAKQLERQLLLFSKTNAQHKDTFIRRGTSLIKTLVRYGATAAGGVFIYHAFLKHKDLSTIFPKKFTLYIKHIMTVHSTSEALIPQAVETIFDNAPETITWFKASKDFLVWYITTPSAWVWFQPWILSYKLSLKALSALQK